MADLLQRLRKRKLVQWALAYVAAALALIQLLDVVAPAFVNMSGGKDNEYFSDGAWAIAMKSLGRRAQRSRVHRPGPEREGDRSAPRQVVCAAVSAADAIEGIAIASGGESEVACAWLGRASGQIPVAQAAVMQSAAPVCAARSDCDARQRNSFAGSLRPWP